MSVYFKDQSGHELWNPGQLTAKLFVEYAAALERALESSSGIGQIVADEVRVDTHALGSSSTCVRPRCRDRLQSHRQLT